MPDNMTRYYRTIFYEREEAKKMATKVGETYLCEICGNKVQVKESGQGELVCCGQKMKNVQA
jgi:superoxide reductase